LHRLVGLNLIIRVSWLKAG